MIGYPYYNETIKQATAVFGSLFNNIVLKRKDGTLTPVPISYGPRDKWLEAQRELEPKEEMFEKLLPRMSYEMVAMTYDQIRKLTNKQKIVGQDYTSTGNDLHRIVGPVPYTLSYSLYITTKNLNDGWQIIENILPFFTPAYTVRVRSFPQSPSPESSIQENEFDMPFTLQSVTWSDDWVGDVGDRRVIEWSLEFETRVWLYGPNVGKKTSIVLDSRAIIATQNGADVENMNRSSNQEGVETGYANIEGDTVILDSDSVISPSVINTFDSDGNIVKIVRDIEIL